MTALGVFVDAGTRHEPEGQFGLCQVVQNAAFQSTSHLSAEELRSVCNLEGITLSGSVLRDCMVFRADALRGSVERAVEILADGVERTQVDAETLEAAKTSAAFQSAVAGESANELVQEVLCEAAFGASSPMGHRLQGTEEQIEAISAADVERFTHARMQPSYMCVSGAGVEHSLLVDLARARFGSLRNAPGTPAPSRSRKEALAALEQQPSQWRGGFAQYPYTPPPGTPADPQMVHIALALPTVGWAHRDVVPITVLDTMLGGGASFSAGGPGKGMYTRLYREVLVRYPWVDAINAFSIQYPGEGFWGLYGSAEVRDTPQLIELMCRHIVRLAGERPASTELIRAKNQLRSSVMMNLEMRGVLCEDMGRQVLVLGERIQSAELAQRIHAVTAHDVQRICAQSLHAKPALAVLNGPPAEELYAQVSAVLEYAAKSVHAASLHTH